MVGVAMAQRGSGMSTALAIEHVSITDLIPDPTNPRRIADGEMTALT